MKQCCVHKKKKGHSIFLSYLFSSSAKSSKISRGLFQLQAFCSKRLISLIMRTIYWRTESSSANRQCAANEKITTVSLFPSNSNSIRIAYWHKVLLSVNVLVIPVDRLSWSIQFSSHSSFPVIPALRSRQLSGRPGYSPTVPKLQKGEAHQTICQEIAY